MRVGRPVVGSSDVARVVLMMAVVLALGLCRPARGERVYQLWRSSPLWIPTAVSVNAADGSCWISQFGGAEVVHVGADGRELWSGEGCHSNSLATNPTDGSCWVADRHGGRVVHLSATGGSLPTGGVGYAYAVAVNSTDGSCWATDNANGWLYHLAADASLLWRGTGLGQPIAVSVNSADGSCWVVDIDGNRVLHYSANHVLLWSSTAFNRPESVSVNSADGSCWVADTLNDQVVHLSKDHTVLWTGTGFSHPIGVSANRADGSCWVADQNGARVVHLDAEGAELLSLGAFHGAAQPSGSPNVISVNPADGSCWLAEAGGNRVVHIAADGSLLWGVPGCLSSRSVSVNASDGSCWTACDNRVFHLSALGSALWVGTDFDGAVSVSVNSTDGSCWVADQHNDRVAHLSAEGALLWSGEAFGLPYVVAANPSDGSCWVSDLDPVRLTSRILRLSSGGDVLWSIDAGASSLSIYPADGSCWAAGGDVLAHFSDSGDVLWTQSGFWLVWAVAVNPTDGSVWVANETDSGDGVVSHFASDGTLLWSDTSYPPAIALSVDTTDGSCWAADHPNSTSEVHLLHFASDGTLLRSSPGPWDIASVSADPRDGSCWVADHGQHERVVHLGPASLTVEVAPALPPVVASGGAAELAALAKDSLGRPITSWLWDDGGLGGVFLPSGEVQNPTYVAPQDGYPWDRTLTLTVRATCAGAPGETALGDTTLLVRGNVGRAQVTVNTLPAATTWEAVVPARLTYHNEEYFPWEVYEGHQLRPEDALGRWSQPAIPLTTDVPEDTEVSFDLTLVAPPVTTLRYDVAASPTAPASAGLTCAFNFCRGDTPLTGGRAASEVVISRFPDDAPGSDGGWARAQIEACAGRVPQIVGGYPNGLYGPTIAVTRDQMAVFIQRALDLPLALFEGHFTDVTADDAWCNQQIEALWRAGLVSGYPDGGYHPTEGVSRIQMAAYIARGILRSMVIPSGPATPSFPDVAPDVWGGYNSVEFLRARAIVSGYPDGQYHPTDPVTRDQMAVFIYRGFIQPTGAAIILAGPAVTGQDPETGGECGWASTASTPVSAPGYAYVAFDAFRLSEAMAADDDWRVRFELRSAAAPATPASGDYTFTRALTAAEIRAGRAAAFVWGYPHWTVSWPLATTLSPGAYLLVVSVEDREGVLREVGRRPALTLTP